MGEPFQKSISPAGPDVLLLGECSLDGWICRPFASTLAGQVLKMGQMLTISTSNWSLEIKLEQNVAEIMNWNGQFRISYGVRPNLLVMMSRLNHVSELAHVHRDIFQRLHVFQDMQLWANSAAVYRSYSHTSSVERFKMFPRVHFFWKCGYLLLRHSRNLVPYSN